MTRSEGQKTILLIDDEADLREVLIDVLTLAGFRIVPAQNGAEALAAFAQGRPDLVILDLMLPDMSGFEVCKRIKRAADGYLPVIMLTARHDMESMIQGLGGAGADDYIVKPFRREELLARIGASLRVKDLYDVIHNQNEMLSALSVTDDLTGLHNRRHLTAVLADRIAALRRAEGSLSCALVDLDRFKQVNDLCGHLVGDDVLRRFSEMLKSRAPEGSICGRWGGDEFLIIFPESLSRVSEIETWARDMVTATEQEKMGAGVGGSNSEYVGVSGGALIVRGPDVRLDPVRLIYDLDALLYQAKKNRRNHIFVSTDPNLGRQTADAAAAAPGGRVVFVLDDNADICAIVRDILSRLSVESMVFQTTDELYKALDERTPNLILLDLKLQDADGVEVCRKLKQNPNLHRTKITFLTAFTSEEVRQKAAEAGADGYILKPFSYSKFVGEVNRLLSAN